MGDLGYAVGAIISGIVTDIFGITAAFILTSAITAISSLILAIRMPSQHDKYLEL